MNFRDVIKADVTNVFMNLEEFASEHTLNDVTVPAVVESEALDTTTYRMIGDARERAGTGIYTGGKIVYVSAEDFGQPQAGTGIVLDGRRYKVTSSEKQDGVVKFTIQKWSGS